MAKAQIAPGTWVERDMIESKAFLSLKGVAPQLLIIFLAKRQFEKQGRKGKEKRVCTNRDTIRFTYVEAEKKYEITNPRFNRAIDDLLTKGFIKVAHQGGARKQDQNIYALSDDWRFWRQGMVLGSRQKDPVPRGFCKPKKIKQTLQAVS